MKKLIVLLSAASALSLVSHAMATESGDTESKYKSKQNGGYESSVSSEEKTPEGTEKTAKTSVDVDVDSSGNVSKDVKTKSTTDPEGLLNKKTHKSEVKVKEKKGAYTRTVKDKTTDAAGTNTSTTSKTDSSVDAQGNVTATTKTEQVVDPKGMMNKRKTTTRTKTVNGEVVEEKKEEK